jgi:uncharacterized phage-associated protein
MYDARQVANCFLDMADNNHCPLTHLALQKIVYFAHGLSYARLGQPLLLNKIEAWKRGPVVRELYFAFNLYGERPIDGRAKLIDLQSRKPEVIAYEFPQDVLEHLRETFSVYGPIPGVRLVAMTHEVGTPWHTTVIRAQKSANVGMHIDESLIKNFFSPGSSPEAHKENFM